MSAGGLVIVDAHAHFHACFGPEDALDAAWGHFRGVAGGGEFTGVLMLAEPEHDEAMSALRAEEWTRWALGSGSDPLARRAQRADGSGALWLVAGFQVPTAEGLEVLCLGCERRPDDRGPIDAVVRQARETGGLAVVPWGAGKWLGRRGAALSRFLETVDDPGVFLGDNGGRPAAWRPRHFVLGRQRGIRVLPGSDPLPFPSESGRLGGHGFTLPGGLSGTVRELFDRLEDPGTRPEPFGRSEAPLRFARNQLAMQWRMRTQPDRC